MSIRPTEYEVRDPRTDIIPLDVCFDPETEIGQINGYRVTQDGNHGYQITMTLEMAKDLVLAIEKLEQSRPERRAPEITPIATEAAQGKRGAA
jgi:hypothetical protein